MFLNLSGNNPLQVFKRKIGLGKKGVSIIEILIVIAIVGFTLVSILGLVVLSLKISTSTKEIVQANALAQETIEAIRNFRDGTEWATNGLGTLTTGVFYHLEKTADVPAKWSLDGGEGTIGNFTQKIIFEDVQRDINDNIVESGGTNDPDTKKITTTISWQERGKTHQIEIITYLTNW